MDNPSSKLAPEAGIAIFSHVRSPLLIGVAGLILSWPAVYNGYPLLWFDSGEYLEAGWLHVYASGLRSPFYGLAIVPLLALQSEWPIVFAQAAISAAMIFLVLRTVLGRMGAGQYLLLIGLLALLTSLPWNASIIMADVYAGLLPLGVFLLAFAHDRLAPREIVFVFGVTCLATLVHYSHLPLAAALAVVALGVLLLERHSPGDVLRSVGPCFAVVVVAIAAHVGLQWTLNGTPAISPNGSVFVLARLVEDGPAKAYLSAHCPERHFALCGFVDDMPMNITRFLWSADGPLNRLGGVAALRDEANTIVVGVLREQPVQVAWLAVRHTVHQLAKFRTDVYVRGFKLPDPTWQTYAASMKDNLPGEYMDFVHSRQSNGNIKLESIFSLQIVTVGISIVLLFVLLHWIVRRNDRRLREFLWLIVATVVGNAAICGALSGPDDRYQSRVIWLLPFLLCLEAISAIDSWIRSRCLAV